MAEAKIESTDRWLSKVLPPQDPPKRDLLDAMEPVYATESGAMEEVSYEVPVIEDDISAESLQRSARRFGTQPPAPKKKEDKEEVTITVTTTPLKVTGLDNIRKNLQETIARLVKQKKITLPEYCHFEVSEYIIKNRNKFPYLNEHAIEVIKRDVEKKSTLSPHDYILKKPGAPDAYGCIISVPQFFASWTESPFRWFAATLQHEVTHCRDSHPNSGMTKLTNALGIDRAVETADYTVLHEYVAYIEQFDSLIKQGAEFTGPVMMVKTEKMLVHFASELTTNLDMLDKDGQHLARNYFAKRIRRISQKVKDLLRKRLVEEYDLDKDVLGLIGL